MTFFEYQVTIAKIDTTNSYQALRKLHKQLVNTKVDNFYSIHAINKTIKKFKELTTSNTVKYKYYPGATSSADFNTAIQSAETKEQILLLLADFQGLKSIELPKESQLLIHMVNLGFTGTEPEFEQISLKAYYYSIGNDIDSDRHILEINRIPMSIICYLKPIESTVLYQTILSDSLVKAKHWNGTRLQNLLDNIDYQIDKQTKQIAALQEAKVLYQELNNDTSGNIQTT